MSPYSIPPIVVAVAIIALGFLVLVQNSRSSLHRAWFALCVSSFVWLFMYGIMYSQQSAETAFFLAKIGYTGVTFIPATFYHFALHLVKRTERRWNLGAYYAVSLGFVLSIWFTSFTVSGITRYFWGLYPKAGVIHPVYLALFIGLLGKSLWVLGSAFRMGQQRFSAQDRARIRIVFLAMSVNCVACADFLPNYGIEIYPFGYLSSGVLIGAVFYAVVKHRFLDTNLVVTRAGLLLGTYLVVLGVPFVVGMWGRDWLEDAIGYKWWLIPLGLSTLLASGGPFAYAYLRRQAEQRLLKEQRRYQQILQHAARGMTRVRSVTRLSRLITRVVSKTVGVTHASLFLWDKATERYLLRASHGPRRLSTQSRYGLEVSNPLTECLRSNRQVLSENDVSGLVDPTIGRELTSLGAVLAIPGLIEDRLIGFLALGEKLSGARYSQDDLHAFSILANEAAMAIENASSYEELLRVNDQLKRASERLLVQERLAAAGQLAAGMAHEVRNPLSAIKTFAQYLPDKYADPVFRDKFFRLVQTEIERIDGIVKELLDFAKPAPLQLQAVSVSKLAEDTLALLSDRCLQQGIQISTSFRENGFTIQADPQQLKQVVLNLFLNSLDAMPKGGRLEVAIQLAADRLALKVSDTGQGIPLDRMHQVWDPFFTTKERGMGLGLAIVKGIVERHGGQIAISSQPGQGTTVQLSLPANPPKAT